MRVLLDATKEKTGDCSPDLFLALAVGEFIFMLW